MTSTRPLTQPGPPPDRTAQGLLAVVVLAMAACASVPPPTAQIDATAAAVAHAAGAGGNELAPQAMQSARSKLQRAEAAVVARDYPMAIALAREAQADAQLAEARAESVKARRAADAASEGNRVLREELQRKGTP